MLLTIVLVVDTIQLLNFLKMLSHTSKKEKFLIGCVTFLFTFSYVVSCSFLIIQLFLVKPDCSCFTEYKDLLWFLYLLPIFDVFPILMILSFDTIRFICASKLRKSKSSEYADRNSTRYIDGEE